MVHRYHLSFDPRRDEAYKRLNRKKTIGLIIGTLYMCFCIYAIFSVEARFNDKVAAAWFETYISSFAFDFVILRFVRTFANIALLIYISGNSLQVGFFGNLMLKILDKNVSIMLL